MARCGVKKGFFILRDCNEITNTICPVCRRPSCEEHTRRLGEPPGVPHCVECFAKAGASGNPDVAARPAAPVAPTELDYMDDSWSYRYRDTYYRGSGYRPIYYGRHPGWTYDDNEYRAFDRDVSDDLETDDEDTGGSLMDS